MYNEEYFIENLDYNQRELHTNFPNTSWFSNETNCHQALLWITFFRRNPHRLATEYLGIKLHWYQSIMIYLMFISNYIVIIAARASAKSFSIAVYAVIKAILYPGSQIILTSGNRGQSKLIITEKIVGYLMLVSPVLNQEVSSYKIGGDDVVIKFHNGSTIESVSCSDTSLGHRSTDNVCEEAKTINKTIMDKVISPFRVIRQVEFKMLPEYAGDPQFHEEPKEILISSSIEESHWLYKEAVRAKNEMLKNEPSFFIAFDYSITLKHGIRTFKQMVGERKKIDPTTWLVEYENAVLRSNSKAYFTYEMVTECQKLTRPFYPLTTEEYTSKSKNKLALPRIEGEIRIVSCDIAAVDRSNNDNSCFSCIRMFRESSSEVPFRVQVPYIEARKGQEIRKQAIRIRQLFNDFDADYIVLDARNIGVSVYDFLARVLYDDERGCEYAPLKSMNDDELAERIKSSNADPLIYTVNASAKLNSDMAVNMKTLFVENQIDLLVNKDDGMEEVSKFVPEYTLATDPEVILRYEAPFLETMLFKDETIKLQSERSDQTGLTRISEKGANTKDRYVSVAMGCYFAASLARDLVSEEEDYSIENLPYNMVCVSALT